MSDSSEKHLYQLKHFKYSSHYWILKFIDQAKRPLRILDVGSADGYLGAILKAQGHRVVGLERDPMLAACARQHYDEFHVADIESFDFPWREEFDCIVFADVLEHLRDPGAVLRRARPALKNRGEFIISMPNVANFTVRLSLLFGRFKYAQRGILDRTHLRFFTLASLRRLVEHSGLIAAQTVATPIPIQLVLPSLNHRAFVPLHELHNLAGRCRKELFAYQFVTRAILAEYRS